MRFHKTMSCSFSDLIVSLKEIQTNKDRHFRGQNGRGTYEFFVSAFFRSCYPAECGTPEIGTALKKGAC